MIAIRRLTKRFSKQTLSEVKPAPLSETVDHTLEDDGLPPPHKAFQCPSPPRSPFPSPSLEEESGDSCEGESEGEEEEVLSFEGRHRRPYLKRRERSTHRELRQREVGTMERGERVPSAEKRKYSQFKCSTAAGSSSASSSDDEVKEAFESCLPSPLDPTPDHTLVSPVQRPIRVAPSGCRKRVPKYFAQMSSTEPVERPRLDFNKMQSKRLVMLRKPVVLRHNYFNPLPSASQCPSLELALDFSSHSFQPVPTQT